jgi:hypothetical protein
VWSSPKKVGQKLKRILLMIRILPVICNLKPNAFFVYFKYFDIFFTIPGELHSSHHIPLFVKIILYNILFTSFKYAHILTLHPLPSLQSFIHAAFSNYTHEYYICNTFRKPAPLLIFSLSRVKYYLFSPF